MTGLTQSASYREVWRADALQESFSFARVGRLCRPTRAKIRDLGGGLPPPNPHCVSPVNDRTYAVPHANAFCLRQHGTCHFICTPRGHPVFALCERKNETQRKMKYRCERSNLGYCVSPVNDRS